MKIKDLIITSIIIAVISLATYYITIEAYTEGAVLYAIAFYTLTYVIVGITREKRLESEIYYANKKVQDYKDNEQDLINEIEKLQIDLANQVKATDILQKRYDNLNAKDEIPFSEDSQPETQGYICPQCGKPMTRMTAHTVFCDNIECTRKQWKRDKLDKEE